MAKRRERRGRVRISERLAGIDPAADQVKRTAAKYEIIADEIIDYLKAGDRLMERFPRLAALFEDDTEPEAD